MSPMQKAKLADIVIDYIAQFASPTKESPRMIGTLNAPLGLVGFKRLEPGTPVFDAGDKYMVIMEDLNGTKSLEVMYYKESLKKHIDFDHGLTVKEL